jgi:hypothetical protein
VKLEEIIGAFQKAGLDASIEGLLDSLWLALNAPVTTYQAEPAPSRKPVERASLRDIASEKQEPKEKAGAAGDNLRKTTAREGQREARDETGLYQHTAGATGEMAKATPVRVPAGAALPGKLKLARAMRPLLERWPSRHAFELDEENTVNATAALGGRLSPVFRARPERWYEATLVVEDAPSMDVWRRTLEEFRQMLEETGAFSDVRVWKLKPGLNPMLQTESGSRVSPGVLTGSRKRRLIFFATHGISPEWRRGSLGKILEMWAVSASVAILHVLPETLWKHTALGEPASRVRAIDPGAATASFLVEQFWWILSFDSEEKRLAVPVVALDYESAEQWAQTQMARGKRAPAFLIRTQPVKVPKIAASRQPSIEQAVQSFRGHASPLAVRLAVYLSSAPFTLPVARLIQTAKFGGHARQSQLAEVLMSAFVQRLTPVDSPAHPDWIQYRFDPKARKLLGASLRQEDALEIAGALEDHVRRFVEEKRGKPVDFRALVRNEHGEFDLPAWAQPFAMVGTALLGIEKPGPAARRKTADGRLTGPLNKIIVSYSNVIQPFGTQDKLLAKTQEIAAKVIGDPAKTSAAMADLAGGMNLWHAAELHKHVLHTPRHAKASLLQTHIAAMAAQEGKLDAFQHKIADFILEGLEVRFSTADWPEWAASLFTWIAGIVPADPPPPDANAAPIGASFSIGVLGDYGTGLYGAPICQNSILTSGDRYDMLLHLGDVYYSATPREVESRFFSFWPQAAAPLHRTLNGNHEMYTGGHSYMNLMLPRFNQSANYFALQNDNWVLIGIDTALKGAFGGQEGAIEEPQVSWIKSIVGAAGNRKVVLFSHHQPFSSVENTNGGNLLAQLDSIGVANKIFAWYWGHEHRCLLYDPHPKFGFRGRCMGHAAFPEARPDFTNLSSSPDFGSQWRRLPAKKETNVPAAWIYDTNNLYIPDFATKFAPNGFLRLEFDGPRLVEFVRAADNANVWLKELT